MYFSVVGKHTLYHELKTGDKWVTEISNSILCKVLVILLKSSKFMEENKTEKQINMPSFC